MAEEYVGIKFGIPKEGLNRATVLTVENKNLIRAMKKAGKVLAEHGLAPGTAGNLSCRVEGGMLITAAGSALSKLSDADFVLVQDFDFEKFALGKAAGLQNPSSETPMHLLAYQSRPEISAIVHVHDPLLADEKRYERLKIRCTPQAHPYGTREQAEAVAEVIKETDFAAIKNHGIIAVGKSIEDTTDRVLNYHRRAQGIR